MACRILGSLRSSLHSCHALRMMMSKLPCASFGNRSMRHTTALNSAHTAPHQPRPSCGCQHQRLVAATARSPHRSPAPLRATWPSRGASSSPRSGPIGPPAALGTIADSTSSLEEEEEEGELGAWGEAPSAEEQAKLDQLAAAIAARLEQTAEGMEPDEAPDLESEQLDGADIDDLLANFPLLKAAREKAETRAARAEAKEKQKEKKKAPKRARGERRPGEKQVPTQFLPKVAIVGRPNVGKSALFNRVVGKNMAIVYDYPGVTRDRLYTRASWGDTEFVVVDTGGLMSAAHKLPTELVPLAIREISADGLPSAIERQAAAGLAEADVVVLVMDGQAGMTGNDEEIAGWLRRSHPHKPVILAVNKCENVAKADLMISEFWNLGLEPIAVSAISGSGTGDLMDAVAAALPPPASSEEVEEDPPLAVAIIGRPNVGKSSLLNAVAGQERSIVSPISGTTRDAIDTIVEGAEGRTFKLVDTAGIRKRTAVSNSRDGAEPLSVNRSLNAIRRAEVAMLVIDARDCTEFGTFTIPTQDYKLAEYIAGEGRACVIVINKWDAVEKDQNTHQEYRKEALAQLRPVDWASVIFTSAMTGQRVQKLLDAAWDAGQEHRRRISTATLNMVVQEATAWKSPPSGRGSRRAGRIYYATQAAVRPPTFVMFVNDASLFPDDYRKYMERQLRENVGFPGTPLRILWRGKEKRGKDGAPPPPQPPRRPAISSEGDAEEGADGL